MVGGASAAPGRRVGAKGVRAPWLNLRGVSGDSPSSWTWTRQPGRGGCRDAAMAPWGLPGSAVLSAAVFVGGAVSSLLVAPGECVVPAGTPGAAESGLHAEGSEGHGGSGLVEPAAPPRLEWLASRSATESGSEHLGVPGWPGQGAARGAARILPHPPAGLPPSFPRLFFTAGSQPGVFRVSPCWGAISPAACPGCPAEDPFLSLILKGLASGRS